MPGTSTSGNRTERRGRRLIQNFHISHGAAVLLRELTRSKLGHKDVSTDELTNELESAIRAVVDQRLKEIEQDAA